MIIGIGIPFGRRGGGSIDPDAAAFIAAAGITDPTQKAAVNTLVVNLKAAGLWTKLKAAYPIVGGSATSHKFNLINPLDTDAAYRINFVGGWTHSANGALPNGVNAYADTFLTPSTDLASQDSQSYGFYSRTDIQEARYTGTNLTRMGIRWTDGNFYALCGATELNFGANANSLGFHLINRVDSSNLAAFIRGTKINRASATAALVNLKFYFAARNIDNTSVLSFNAREIAFATIGEGLTDTNATDLTSIINTFQTTLGRAV
jgi:hypothetical protein